jgi:hypothetical protein
MENNFSGKLMEKNQYSKHQFEVIRSKEVILSEHVKRYLVENFLCIKTNYDTLVKTIKITKIIKDLGGSWVRRVSTILSSSSGNSTTYKLPSTHNRH